MPAIGAANEPRFLFQVADTDLLVVDFTAGECVSAPYEIRLTLASEDDVSFETVISKPASLTVQSGDSDRYFQGIIDKFVQTGTIGRFFMYQARVVPAIWLLSLEHDCRIFQKKTTEDIVKQVLKEAGILSDDFEFRLQNQYTPREYCVQYRETDLDFISRLLEEEGIFYVFEHTAEKALLIFGDSTVNYQAIKGEAGVVFNPTAAMVPEEESVTRFNLSRRLRSGKVTLKDFNFEKPDLDLTAAESAEDKTQLEVYTYPGRYGDETTGKKLAQIRLQEKTLFRDQAEGDSFCPRFVPGFTFTLSGHELEHFNLEYLITEVVHKGSQPQVLQERAPAEAGFTYANHFFGIPSTTPLRPERKTPKPVVEGVQTAIVTGPSGEEIYTDKFGRIKVQFHWDREGQRNERSSCWIRVSHAWAGAGWGVMYVPRIGQEVIVDFLEGNPDCPIVIGCVYDGNNMPPYGLPGEKTKSTIMSNSSKGGGGSNEIRFEDAKGSEEIFVHGQKDWTIAIENDKNQTVGNDESLTVENNRTKSVGADQSETIGANKSIRVGTNHNEKIGANMTLSVGSNKTETVTINTAESIGAAKELTIGGLYQVSVGGAMNEIIGAAKAEEIGAVKAVAVAGNSSEKVGANKSINASGSISESAGNNFSVDADKDVSVQSGKKMSLTAGDDFSVAGKKKGVIDIADQLTLKVGKASITLKKNGDIIIQGKDINAKGSGNIVMKAKKILEN
jgi:type VI secretion system secreted protein VgrG